MTQYRLFHTVMPGLASEQQLHAVADCSMGFVAGAVGLGLYREVALLEAREIDEIFGLTNHIDRPWTRNEGVLAHAERVRSTSVGDLVMEVESGMVFHCIPIGWTPLDDDLAEAFRAQLGNGIEVMEEAAEAPAPG